MMKLFALFFALTAVLAQPGEKSKDLSFSFNETDGVSEPQFMTLPFNYGGIVNLSISEPHTDLWICLHWVVPVVAPYGEEIQLDEIWSKTCTLFQSVEESVDPFSLTGTSLRSGDYYVTAAVNTEDIDSTGIISGGDYDFTLTVSYEECPENVFGESCTHPYAPLSYDTVNQISLTGTSSFFALPTMMMDPPALFASSLKFNIVAQDGGSDFNYFLAQRLMGAPDGQAIDGAQCEKPGPEAECKINEPPFIFTPGYHWGIRMSANTEVDVNVTLEFKYCEDKQIGTDCKDYEEIDNFKVGQVRKFSKATTIVFGNNVSVAVGGLDGYEQLPVAPDVVVQVDGKPIVSDESSYNVLVSKGAQANVAIIDAFSANPNTKIVLYINPEKNFGIWKVNDEVQCPNDCDVHGNCSSLEYVCMCDSKYEDLDCGHEIKDFTIEYIILIAVGSLLILSIVIGVPIYCFLNRNQEYETVA